MSLTVGERAGSLRPARTLLAPGLEIARIVTGLWQVADMERGGTALLAKWGVTLTPVPEPNTISLLYMGLGALALYRRRRR
jgi:hypothetical protein